MKSLHNEAADVIFYSLIHTFIFSNLFILVRVMVDSILVIRWKRTLNGIRSMLCPPVEIWDMGYEIDPDMVQITDMSCHARMRMNYSALGLKKRWKWGNEALGLVWACSMELSVWRLSHFNEILGSGLVKKNEIKFAVVITMWSITYKYIFIS